MRAAWWAAVAIVGCGKAAPDRNGGSSSVASSFVPSSSGASVEAKLPASGPDCQVDGCLRKVERVGDYGREAIAATLSPGVSIENGYSIATITFWTSAREARATVATPFGREAPPGGWHVVANDHGTVGVDDPCAVAGTLSGAGLAGTFGARGLVGVAVDYPGLGTPGLHPYLVADSEGHATLDAIRATRAYAKQAKVPLSERFAVVGLSQGGHAALSAAARHKAYAPELDVRAFAVVGPASAWEEHWRLGAKLDGPFAGIHAMLMYAWSKHYDYRGPSIWSDGVASKIDEVMGTSCAFPGAGQATLATRLGTSMEAIFSSEFLEAYRSGAWGRFEAFHTYFASNRIGPYEQTAPLKVFQGDLDSIVPETATREVVETLQKGGVEVEYEVVPGGQHTNVAFGFVAYPELRTAESIAWLRKHLDGPIH